MEESTSASPKRIPSLDGLRTISILLVIVAHFVHTLGFKDYNLGFLGVRVFFVISGFLITGLLLKELDRTSTIRLGKFYFRRTLRIFPPFYFYLCVILLFYVAAELAVPLAWFLPAFTYTSNYIDPHIWNLGHTWSLSVEEQFYLIYPGVLFFLNKRKTVWLLGFLILISPVIRIIDFQLFGEARWVGMGFHSNADALAFGCLLTFLHKFLHQNRWYLRLLNSKLMFLAPLLIILFNAQAEHPKIFAVTSSMSNLLIALCVDWAVTNYENNFVGDFLNSSPMVMLGVMSYSIYLWQQPFLNPQSPAWFTAFPINLVGIVLCSCFSYFIIEKFSLRCRQNLERKLFPAPKEKNTVWRHTSETNVQLSKH